MENPESANGRVQMSELDYLKLQMNQRTDQSLDSTRQMVRLCDESQQAGASTLNQLYSQGQQLRNVDENLDIMDQDLREARKNIDELDKCCGLCVLPWKKKKPPQQAAVFKTAANYASAGDANSARTGYPYAQNTSGVVQQPITQGQYITRITNDAREDEMERNLGQVASMVTELKGMATDMGNEITSHNRMLDRIDNKTTANQIQLKDAQGAADKIVGQPSKQKEESILPSNPKLAAAKMLFK